MKLIEQMSLEELSSTIPHRIICDGNSYYLSIRAYDNDPESQIFYQVSWRTLLDEKLYGLNFFGASFKEALGCALINYRNNNPENDETFSNANLDNLPEFGFTCTGEVYKREVSKND